MPRLVRADRPGSGAVSPPPDSPPPPGGPPSRAARRHHPGRVVVGVLGAAAVVAAVVLGLSWARAEDRITQLQSAAGGPSPVAQALATPDHRMVTLRTPTQETVGKFVMLPDGRGYLVSSALPTLGTGRTYQLWGIVGGKAISLGLLGAAPHQAAFTLAGAWRAWSLGLTAEPAGGSVTPTLPVLASGTA